MADETLSPRQVVERWVECFNRADLEAIAALYAQDAVNHQVVAEPMVGRPAIRAMFEREFSSADMTCLIEAIHEARDGEVIALEWSDPNGLRGCGFFTVRDGRIVHQRGYYDRLSFSRLQGLPIDGAA